MEALLSDFTTFVTSAVSSIGTVVTAITDQPLLLIGIFAGLLGLGIGIIKRFV